MSEAEPSKEAMECARVITSASHLARGAWHQLEANIAAGFDHADESARRDLARQVLKIISGFNRQMRKVDVEALLKDLFNREGIEM